MNVSSRVARLWPSLVLPVLLALQSCGGGSEAPAEAPRAAALALTPAQAALARWSAKKDLTLVPVGGSLLPNGKVLFWSAEKQLAFYTTPFNGRTWTSLYDPATDTATEKLVSETAHNMFCPGTSNLPDGRILINGGIDSNKTSIYDPFSNSWSSVGDMNIYRGYQGNATLRDGSVLTLGGSWSGGAPGNRHGEIWTATAGWRRLSGVPIDSMLSVDTSRNFGGDSHAWLIPTANGRVLYAGPSVNMQWIGTSGNGSVEAAGARGDDQFSVNGIAVMYDAGKILKSGGAPGYEGFAANANSYVIDTTSGAAVVRKIPSMAYQRAFHNTAVLPNGQVVVIGGQTVEQAFSDSNSVLAPEIFDPATETWTTLPVNPSLTGRNYHSITLLMPDARVLSGGGGLCGDGCAGNHPDFEMLSPPYLFNADGSDAARPAILSAPASTGYGTTMAVTADSAVSAFSMVRMGTATHSVNNDQRRVALSHTDNGGGSYTLQVPSNPGILLPGYWMLFAMNAQGTPSVAKIVRVDAAAAPKLEPVADQSGNVGVGANLALSASNPAGGALSYSAVGLPAGLTINPASGVISGSPTAAGRSLVTVTAANAAQKTSTEFVWTIGTGGGATTWTRCATEGGTCSFSGTRSVRYGANGTYATRTATGSIVCSNGVFGDPLYGVPKACDYADTAAPATAAAPSFSPAGGSYASAQSVTLATGTAGATIYYTTNGSTPTTASTPYAGPIAISASTTLQALATAPGYANSSVASATYTIGGSGGGGGWTRCAGEGQTCSFSGTKTVRYGANGTYATRTATGSIACTNAVFGDPIYGVVKACEVQDGTTPPVPTAATPSFSPAGGSYTSAQTVSITSATSGTSIFYTLNGALPTSASPLYSGPLTISATATLRALATAPGYTDSAVASATYTIGSAGATWTRCGYEGTTCSFSGTKTVRYGANGTYVTRVATGSIVCSNGVFGDPLFGVPKACDYQ